jgi:hypothetical protein
LQTGIFKYDYGYCKQETKASIIVERKINKGRNKTKRKKQILLNKEKGNKERK